MTDRDDLAARLDDVADTLGEPSRDWFGTMYVYPSADGYVTHDGEPVPTDADGDPDPPGTGENSTVVILDGRYAEDPPDAAIGATSDDVDTDTDR